MYEYNFGTLIIDATLQESLIIKISSMIGHASTDQIFIRKLTEIVLANLGNENFGAKELTHESGLSRHTLDRRIKAASHKTLSQFIREIRLHRALEMLQSENVTASEVAYKVGFTSPAYFNTCFHEFFGYPPGKVKKDDLKNPQVENHIQANSNKRSKRIYRLTFLIFAPLFLAGIVYLVYFTFLKNSGDNNTQLYTKEKSIAVLPFTNLSTNIEDTYFIDGVMEEVLTNLSRIHNLRVISRTSVEQFRESRISTSEIAKKLNVGRFNECLSINSFRIL